MVGAEIDFLGLSTACFGLQCTPAIISSIDGVTYYGSTFEGRTDDGFVAFGGDGSDDVQNAQNFGRISARVSNIKYSALPFMLVLDFSLTSGVAGNALHYSAILNRNLRAGSGGVSLVFENNGSHSYSFGDHGNFDLYLDNLGVALGHTAGINGFIANESSSQIPEPTPSALIGISLVGAIACGRLPKHVRAALVKSGVR
jgi:hypothetical protein